MPAKKKGDVKGHQEAPAYVDEVGTFVHEAHHARYRGGVRRFGPADSSAGSGATAGGKGAKGAAPTSTDAEAGAAGGAPSSSNPNAMRFRHGYGTYLSPFIKYVGDWAADEMHGHGHLEFLSSGHVYDGDFGFGKFHGKGVYLWKDGSRYEGSWVDSKMHGEGTYTDVEGRVWKGKFYNGSGPGLHQLCEAALPTAPYQ